MDKTKVASILIAILALGSCSEDKALVSTNAMITLISLFFISIIVITLLLITILHHKHEMHEQQRNIEVYKMDSERYKLEHDEKQTQLLISNLQETDIYQSFHNPMFMPSQNDFALLGKELDNAYNGFCYRLKKLYPKINDLEIWMSCLVKIGLRSKEICNYIGCKPNTLNMKKVRLYRKIFGEAGLASDYDKFIIEF